MVRPLFSCLTCAISTRFLRLSEMMLNLLEISLESAVPASLRNIPDKYNIIICFWTNCFYRLLENLRRSSLASKIALEYLQEFRMHTLSTQPFSRETFSWTIKQVGSRLLVTSHDIVLL